MEPVKVGFEVAESHLALWERTNWRYAFLMGGRGNGRSGTASRYSITRLLSKEYTRGAISVDFGIKHVQGLPISYTRRSVNLHHEYENYAWKVNKDGENVGIEDPKTPNHAMSATRYGLTTLAAAGSTYDPKREERARVEVAVTRRKLQGNQAR
jgi:phage terminase large subunit